MENLGDVPDLRFAPSVLYIDVSYPVHYGCSLGSLGVQTKICHTLGIKLYASLYARIQTGPG